MQYVYFVTALVERHRTPGFGPSTPTVMNGELACSDEITSLAQVRAIESVIENDLNASDSTTQYSVTVLSWQLLRTQPTPPPSQAEMLAEAYLREILGDEFEPRDDDESNQQDDTTNWDDIPF